MHPKTNALDQLSTVTPSNVTPSLRPFYRKVCVQFGETIQQNGLRIRTDRSCDSGQMRLCRDQLQDWNGKGFLMESSMMTPTQVSDRTLSPENQKIAGHNHRSDRGHDRS